MCDFDLTQRVPAAYDLGYFLYRSAGKAWRSQGGVARIDQAIADGFISGYLDGEPTHPVPPRADIARELRRFALYDCLLEANNTRDAKAFDGWASDALALEGNLAEWVGNPA